LKIFKKNTLLYEIFITGFITYIFVLFINALRRFDFAFFLPNKITIFEILKNYFLAITLLIIFEYLFSYELLNNYLLARICGLFVMITFTLVAFNLFSKTWIFQNRVATNLIYITSIFYGSCTSFLVSKIKIKKSLLIGIAYYIIIAFLFLFFSFIANDGYIFN